METTQKKKTKRAVGVLRADTVTKDFISDTEVFADVFNYYIYEGRQVIRPEELTERDSTEIVLPYGSDGKKVPVQRFRDVRKLYTSMTDGKAEYVLYGVENQSDIHYQGSALMCTQVSTLTGGDKLCYASEEQSI